MKKTVFWSVILLLALSFIGWRYYTSSSFQPDPTRCGVIVDKSAATALDIHKYSGTLEVVKVFTIKLDNGQYYEQQVGSDYAKFNVGDRVCYSYSPHQSNGTIILDLFAIMLAFVIGIIVFAFFCMLISSLYETFIED